jgi:hypothetical protein
MGPCSIRGDKGRFEELNEIVCDLHFTCNMDPKREHDFITFREWLLRRNKLRTGKTV